MVFGAPNGTGFRGARAAGSDGWPGQQNAVFLVCAATTWLSFSNNLLHRWATGQSTFATPGAATMYQPDFFVGDAFKGIPQQQYRPGAAGCVEKYKNADFSDRFATFNTFRSSSADPERAVFPRRT